jgi:DNA topoisomerase-2
MKNINEILKNFYIFRLSWYQKRKDYMVDKINKELIYLDSKIKFILDIIENKLIINNTKKTEIEEYLEKNNYPKKGEYEKKEELLNELNNKKNLLALIELTKIEQMWLNDLEVFEKDYQKYVSNRLSELDEIPKKKKITSK